MEMNTMQRMEDHEHGIRFRDDEGRCLACCVSVRDQRIAALEAAVAKAEGELDDLKEQIADGRCCDNVDRLLDCGHPACVMSEVCEICVEQGDLESERDDLRTQLTAESTLRKAAETRADDARWVASILSGNARLTRREYDRMAAAIGHMPQGWVWLDDVQMWERYDRNQLTARDVAGRQAATLLIRARNLIPSVYGAASAGALAADIEGLLATAPAAWRK